MGAVVVISKNQDFTEVVSVLLAKELGVACHVVPDAAGAIKWPDALVIQDETLPVRMHDVLGKVRRFLQNARADEKITIGGWQLSARLKTLSCGSKSLDLTDKEVKLVQCLHKAGEQGLEREELLKRVWGFDPDINTHTLETHIYRLRGKLREISGDALSIEAAGGTYKLECKA